MTNALATYNPRAALEPTSFDEGARLAKIVSESKLFGVKSAAEAFIRISTGMSLGLSAMQGLRGVNVVDGKPCLSSDMMAAVCLASPHCEHFEAVETSESVATYRTKRKGRPEQTLSFTWEQANLAGLTGKDNWKKYRAQMLRARCISGLARMVFPDLLLGLYTPDELGAKGEEPSREAATDFVPRAVEVVVDVDPWQLAGAPHDADGVVLEPAPTAPLPRVEPPPAAPPSAPTVPVLIGIGPPAQVQAPPKAPTQAPPPAAGIARVEKFKSALDEAARRGSTLNVQQLCSAIARELSAGTLSRDLASNLSDPLEASLLRCFDVASDIATIELARGTVRAALSSHLITRAQAGRLAKARDAAEARTESDHRSRKHYDPQELLEQ